MMLTKLKMPAVVLLACLAVTGSGWLLHQALAQKPEEPTAAAPTEPGKPAKVDPLSAEQFTKMHALIKPQPGESKWAEIPWLLSVHEARKKAAAEGKPIFIWAGGGAPPIGIC